MAGNDRISERDSQVQHVRPSLVRHVVYVEEHPLVHQRGNKDFAEVGQSKHVLSAAPVLVTQRCSVLRLHGVRGGDRSEWRLYLECGPICLQSILERGTTKE